MAGRAGLIHGSWVEASWHSFFADRGAFFADSNYSLKTSADTPFYAGCPVYKKVPLLFLSGAGAHNGAFFRKRHADLQSSQKSCIF